MGHNHSLATGNKFTGRLSHDEAAKLLAAFHFRQTTAHHHHQSLNSSKSESAVLYLTIPQFLDHFPTILQPFVAAVIAELGGSRKKKRKTGGRLTAESLIEIGKSV